MNVIPDSAIKLSNSVIVSRAEANAIGHAALLGRFFERMANQTLIEAMRRTLKRIDDPIEKDVTLRIDCYVLSREDMESLIKNAREEGYRNAFRFLRPE